MQLTSQFSPRLNPYRESFSLSDLKGNFEQNFHQTTSDVLIWIKPKTSSQSYKQFKSLTQIRVYLCVSGVQQHGDDHQLAGCKSKAILCFRGWLTLWTESQTYGWNSIFSGWNPRFSGRNSRVHGRNPRFYGKSQYNLM